MGALKMKDRLRAGFWARVLPGIIVAIFAGGTLVSFANDSEEFDELDDLEQLDTPAVIAAPTDDLSQLDELDVAEEITGEVAGVAGQPTTRKRQPIAPNALSVEPKTRFTVSGGAVQLRATGGFPPYSYQVISGEGSVDAQGLFKAGSTLGTTQIRVTDSQGVKRDAVVSVQAPLEMKLTSGEGDAYSFEVRGGAPPIRFSIESQSLSENGKDPIGNDRGYAVLVVKDAAGSEKKVSIQIERIAPLLAVAEKPEVNPEREIQIQTAGGQGPYQFEIAEGGGTVDAKTGMFKAPKDAPADGGETTIKVTDFKGQSQQVKVRVANPRAPASEGAPSVVSTSGEPGRMIVGGAGHTCVLDRGELSCWGQNRFGEVGDGTRERRVKPLKVPGFSGTVASVVAGYNHTCALTGQGKVYCWGDNRYGQLGDGTLNASSTPVQLPLSQPASMIAAGQYHGCAVLKDASVRCWGSNRRGQLGTGTFKASPVPVAVRELGGGVRQVAAGAAHTCALLQGGAVKCWGFNSSGQLGEGSMTDRPLPIAVKQLDGARVEGIALGGFHSCAKREDGVRCWGANEMGQLGDGTDQKKQLPGGALALNGKVAALSAGYYHTCVTLEGGAVNCWGWNQQGQVGSGDDQLRLRSPASVQGLSGATLALGCGVDHTCALAEDGLRCWGSNAQGQFGNRTLEASRKASAPVPIHGSL